MLPLLKHQVFHFKGPNHPLIIQVLLFQMKSHILNLQDKLVQLSSSLAVALVFPFNLEVIFNISKIIIINIFEVNG